MSVVAHLPLHRTMARAFNQSTMPLYPPYAEYIRHKMFNDDDTFPIFPYWRHVPFERSLKIGSALGVLEDSAEKFAVRVDVSHFKPDEIRVNLAGNELTIDCTHEEKIDAHGSIKRSFVRKYILPDDVDLEAIRSSLSDKGHLTIEAPKKDQLTAPSRAIPITKG